MNTTLRTQAMSYSPQEFNSGQPLAGLLAQVIISTIEKAKPNHIPSPNKQTCWPPTLWDKGFPLDLICRRNTEAIRSNSEMIFIVAEKDDGPFQILVMNVKLR